MSQLVNKKLELVINLFNVNDKSEDITHLNRVYNHSILAKQKINIFCRKKGKFNPLSVPCFRKLKTFRPVFLDPERFFTNIAIWNPNHD